jgi:dihydrodipicolinate synthase/N-acetylneuraminate lyase
VTLYNSFINNDLDSARRAQEKIIEFFRIVDGHHSVVLACQKHLMKNYSGIEAGSMYSPLYNLPKKTFDDFVAALGATEVKSSK